MSSRETTKRLLIVALLVFVGLALDLAASGAAWHTVGGGMVGAGAGIFGQWWVIRKRRFVQMAALST
jgi:hypothetical protein